jgi:fibronectin-binding autotransporter adhesin
VISSGGTLSVLAGGTASGTTLLNGGHEILSSGAIVDATVISSGGTLSVMRGVSASGTAVLSGGHEIVSSGGFEAVDGATARHLQRAAAVEGGGAVDFGISGGILQLDSVGAFGGAISGFQLGDEIDLRGLAFTSGKDTLSWTQLTSGADASGTLTVTSGSAVESLTLVGSYTMSNFSQHDRLGGPRSVWCATCVTAFPWRGQY